MSWQATNRYERGARGLRGGMKGEEMEGWGAEPGCCPAHGSRGRPRAWAKASLGAKLEPVVVGEGKGQVHTVSGTGLGARERKDCGGGAARGRGLACPRPVGAGPTLGSGQLRVQPPASCRLRASPPLLPGWVVWTSGSVGVSFSPWPCRPFFFFSVFVLLPCLPQSLSLSPLRGSFSRASVSETWELPGAQLCSARGGGAGVPWRWAGLRHCRDSRKVGHSECGDRFGGTAWA